MSTASSPMLVSRLSIFRNWISLTGLVVVLGSAFSFFLLCTLDAIAHVSNPYVGVLTYLVTPAFTLVGLFLTLSGAWLRRRRLARAGSMAPALAIDLSRSQDRRILGFFAGGTILFLLASSVGTYQTYHFTESVQFCGQACHSVMKPEMVTYQNGPHARVPCSECHIGPGATWYVRSKLSGTYQVYATLSGKFPRPIPTPIKHLRPAQETCEQCHWPKKFVGNVEHRFAHFLGDQTNTYHEIRMLLKVGGADPTHGPEGGIHWHMNVDNKVEYVAADAGRQKIPWVRLTDRQGVVTEFRSQHFTNKIYASAIRTMDCMDCHNRPAHRLESPNSAVDLAMWLGKIDPSLPYIKTNAVYALVRCYTNETEAFQGIATYLSGRYLNHPRIRAAITAVQEIYKNGSFPEMKANWRVYPDHIGHKDWPGCFRCHDGNHKTTDGKRTITDDCNGCHLILAQGSGRGLEQLLPQGQSFKHPGEDYEKGFLCSDCHTGGP